MVSKIILQISRKTRKIDVIVRDAGRSLTYVKGKNRFVEIALSLDVKFQNEFNLILLIN